MDLTFSAEEQAFREEVRSFLRDHLPKRLSEKVRRGQHLCKADMEEWHAILNGRGWLAAHWPTEWGGSGWNVTQRFIFDMEAALARTPRILPFGVNMLGPVLIKYGSEAQRRYWLPRILDGSDWWCQGFSEPGAGSDLAGLKCKAERKGDYFVVNGQKTWTTLGHFANMIFCLVRTDPSAKKQAGISFLLIDINSPGVEVRPIVLLDGHHEVNEVFFTDVEVPAENLVGEENHGWTYAKYLLTYERTNIADVGGAMAAFAWLLRIAGSREGGRRPLTQDPYFAARLARVEIALDNMRTTSLRVLSAPEAGGAGMAVSSMLKIKGSELRQEISDLARRALGPHAQPFLPEDLDEDYSDELIKVQDGLSSAAQYFNLRKLSIFGGSNEIQREIISKAILEF
jgi:hypothetical protein